MKKRLNARILAGLTIAAVLTVAFFLTGHSLFLRSLATYPGRPIADVAWYTPLRTVPGAWTRPVPAWEGDPPVDPAALQAVTDYAEQRRSSALLVAYQGRIILERYFRGADAGTTTNAMSMTKTLVALLVGIAIEEGDIPSIETPLSAYIPEYGADDRSRITFDHALQMASGLRLDDSKSDPFSDLLQMHMGGHVMATALAVPAVEPPGQRFEYNNVNTQIIAHALSRATGRQIAGYLSEKLWQPLGANAAHWWLDREGGMVKAYCCLFATARDWLRVGLLMLDGGAVAGRQVIPRRWIEMLTTPSDHEPDYGRHLWLARSRDGVRRTDRKAAFVVDDMYFLDGMDKQRVYIVPSRQLVILRVGERPADWDESFLVNTIVRDLPR